MIVSFGNSPLKPQTSKEKDIKKSNDNNLKNDTDSKVSVEKLAKDSVELSTVKPEKLDSANEDATKVDAVSKDKEKAETKSVKNESTDVKDSKKSEETKINKNFGSKLAVLNKILPKENEQISAKTILGMSTLASGVAVAVGLFNRSFIRTAGIVAAFFTPYLLTKGVELINDQAITKKD
jgi:sorbitol-specific phosphotransferase system component IIBC